VDFVYTVTKINYIPYEGAEGFTVKSFNNLEDAVNLRNHLRANPKNDRFSKNKYTILIHEEGSCIFREGYSSDYI